LLAHPRPDVRFGVVENEQIAYVPLTQGKWAIVDICNIDYVLSLSKNWYWRKGKDYAFATVNGKPISLHNAIFTVQKGFEVDHKNRSGLDCRISNLRASTRGQNIANSNRKRASGFRGVYPIPNGKFRARMIVGGASKNLGIFDNATDAALAWDEEAHKVHKEFAMLNFPEKWFREGA